MALHFLMSSPPHPTQSRSSGKFLLHRHRELFGILKEHGGTAGCILQALDQAIAIQGEPGIQGSSRGRMVE